MSETVQENRNSTPTWTGPVRAGVLAIISIYALYMNITNVSANQTLYAMGIYIAPFMGFFVCGLIYYHWIAAIGKINNQAVRVILYIVSGLACLTLASNFVIQLLSPIIFSSMD
jgi:hypothetical protein